MHILIIGPDHHQGSIPPYLAVLTHALRELGTTVDRLGSSGVPYDIDAGRFRTTEDIVHAARQLLGSVELGSYDVISLHFGNLEIEQLLPALWADRPHPPVTYHVHTMTPTLFTDHIPDQHLHHRVLEGLQSVDGLVYFGHHAATAFTHAPTVPSVISWLPTTIPPGTTPRLTPALERALTLPDRVPLVSLYGYAAPWKDPALLLTAASQLDRPLRIVLAGPGWDDPARAGMQLRSTRLGRNGCVEFVVVSDYLHAGHRHALAAATDLAVFPYQPHASFQGSGAIADYLAHGVPVLATDVANMAELVSDGGALVPPRDPKALADALRRLTADTDTSKHAAAAACRTERFTAGHHASTCLALYEHVTAHTRTATRR